MLKKYFKQATIGFSLLATFALPHTSFASKKGHECLNVYQQYLKFPEYYPGKFTVETAKSVRALLEPSGEDFMRVIFLWTALGGLAGPVEFADGLASLVIVPLIDTVKLGANIQYFNTIDLMTQLQHWTELVTLSKMSKEEIENLNQHHYQMKAPTVDDIDEYFRKLQDTPNVDYRKFVEAKPRLFSNGIFGMGESLKSPYTRVKDSVGQAEEDSKVFKALLKAYLFEDLFCGPDKGDVMNRLKFILPRFAEIYRTQNQ